MSNCVVVITGATKGLGQALALAFGAKGHKVLGTYRSDSFAAQKLEEELSARAIRCRLLRADVSEGCDHLRQDEWIAAAHSIILINNVGPSFEPKPMHLIKWPEFAEILNQGMAGVVNTTLALLPVMLKTREVSMVLNIASSAATTPPKGFCAYAAAKAALLSFTRSLSVEYGARGLRVFSFSPAFILTPTTNAWHPTLVEAIIKSQGRALDSTEVAERVFALASDPLTPGHGEDYLIEPGIS